MLTTLPLNGEVNISNQLTGCGLETVEEEMQALNISPTPKAPSPIKRSLTSLQGPQKVNGENSRESNGREKNSKAAFVSTGCQTEF